MKITLENIGKIKKNTTFDINGITVLAGANGSGKSTVGKVLYSVYKTFYEIDRKIKRERARSIDRIIRIARPSSDEWMAEGEAFSHFNDYYTHYISMGEITDLINAYDSSHETETIHSWVTKVMEDSGDGRIEEVTGRIKKMLDIPTKDIIQSLLERRLRYEFDMQIKNSNFSEELAIIEVQIKDERIKIEIGNDSRINIVESINLVKKIVYVDDPYVIDSVNEPMRGMGNHRNDLARILRGRPEDGMSAVDDVVMSQQLKEIDEKLNIVCSGELSRMPGRGYFYKDKNHQEGLSVVNLATGLKSYVILKTLLKNGFIEENGIIILDEPEVHLHPEWMKVYAELIALLQKTLNLNILISTHSDDFLSFLELACKKNGIYDKCNFYLMKENLEGTTDTENVTGDISVIYKEMNEAFLRTSEELDRIDENF